MMDRSMFSVTFQKIGDITPDIDSTFNHLQDSILALNIGGGTYEGMNFVDIFNSGKRIILDQKIYKLINKVNGLAVVASLDNPTDFLGIKTRQTVKRFPSPIYGTVNHSQYGNIVKSQGRDVWYEWDQLGKPIRFPTDIEHVLNTISTDGNAEIQIAKRVGDKDISVFLNASTFETYSEMPEPTSHKVYPIVIKGKEFYAVKSKADDRKFFDVKTGKVLFTTPKKVSSVINHVEDIGYIIRGENGFFYHMRFDTKKEELASETGNPTDKS
jgi:hypothetical protein